MIVGPHSRGLFSFLLVCSAIISLAFIAYVHIAYQGLQETPSTFGLAPIESSVRAREANSTVKDAQQKSSVDYHSCCGLGHRLSKVVDAHYIARFNNVGLRVFWGFCDQTEVFHYFFGPQPLDELKNVTDRRRVLKINNEAPCFKKINRKGNGTVGCLCPMKYIEESAIFYGSLVRRFQQRDRVERFRKQYGFDKHTVIGLHVRAGNGETGSFSRGNRAINDTSTWTKSMAQTILNISENSGGAPPLLFLATDTASMALDLRNELSGRLEVVTYEQQRLVSGRGVAFGEAGADKPTGNECLLQWENALMDMMILSSADVVVAGRPSSFVQSLPMSIAFSQVHRKTPRVYCELLPDATEHRCFEDFREWCCFGETNFHLQGIKRYEYRRMPSPDFDTTCDIADRFEERPRNETRRFVSPTQQHAKQRILPYDWSFVQLG